ncbi:LOW QUALITY PROTEIN: meprin A subunit beta-like [Anableps anableps]
MNINAKGVILKAFDQYTLKTCIDFTPWKGEENYISVFKGSKEHNFKTYDDAVSNTLGVPYDSSSVMPRSKTAFNIDSEPTIVTKIPQLMDVIGTASDLTKLNLLYNCTKSSSFVDSCDFEEENICRMIQCSGAAMWEQCSSVTGGPLTDFTNMGQCKGRSASLQSRWLYPKAGPQCVQFFLNNTGAVDDVLNIWVKEYDSANPSSKLNIFNSISGGVMGSWELHNVSLNVTQKARVVFEEVRESPSHGGFSLDDIYLSSTKCPAHLYIRNMIHLLATTPPGRKVYSPRFLAPSGYFFQVGVYLNGRSDRPRYFHLTSGPNDHSLKWPCPWQQATTALMDQQPDVRQQVNMHCMVTTDPNKMSSDGSEYYWDDPRKVGSKVTMSDGSPSYGTSTFISHSRLMSRSFTKGDYSFFLLSLEGGGSFCY